MFIKKALGSIPTRIIGIAQNNSILRKLSQTPLGRRLRRFLVPLVETNSYYNEFMSAYLVQRAAIYSKGNEPGLLSFITTVWNTDVEYLDVLAKSLLEQRGGADFEWIILDNGSEAPETISYLDKLEHHPSVRLFKTDKNLGIIGGMQYCLKQATGRYILPLDSDDYLYPDCLNILKWYIKKHNYPPLLFTDEDKLIGNAFTTAYFKPDWDIVLFVHSCYIAHLCVIDRKLALELGTYSNKKTEGCHDWDTFMRFSLSGHVPVHIPEVVYSWRMHEQSTSSNINSKDYIHDSHKAVLNKFIAANPAPEMFHLELSPLFHGMPDWRISREHIKPRLIVTVCLQDLQSNGDIDPFISEDYSAHRRIVLSYTAQAEELYEIAQKVSTEGGLIHLLWEKVSIEEKKWPWEAIALMELFPDTVSVGGRIINSDLQIRSSGYYLCFGKGCDCPDKNRSINDPGYFAQMWKPHSVNAVSSQHAVFDPSFLCEVIEYYKSQPISIQYLGAWAGAYAKRRKKRVIYTPFIQGTCDDDWDSYVTQNEKDSFIKANEDIIPETHLLSPRLGLSSDKAYLPVMDSERKDHIKTLIA